MKKFRKIISIFGLLLFISACSKTKKDEPVLPVPDPAASFSVILDGKPFNADTAYAISNGSLTTEIIVYDEFGQTMGLNIYGSTPGSYSFADNSCISVCLLYGYHHYATHRCVDRTGSFILTKFDSAGKKISGTFTFSGKEELDTTTHVMTEGKIVNLPLTVL